MSDQHNTEHHTLLREAIARLDAVLPIQAPLQNFVHFNPLMHYEHLPFPQALREVHQQTGALGYLPAAEYRQFFYQGRINSHDITSILTQDGVPQAEQTLWLTVLVNDIKAISFQQMHWQVEENNALEHFQADVPFEQREKLLESAGQSEAQAIRALWETCLQRLGLHYDLLHPEALLNLGMADIDAIWRGIKQHGKNGAKITDAESFINAESHHLLHTLSNQVGTRLTLRGLLKNLTGIDVMEAVLPQLARYLSSWLDQGIAGLPPRATSFYAYWRESLLQDITPWLEGMDHARDYLLALPPDPLETIHHELIRIGIDKAHWGSYLQVLALELPGWSGMVNWRANNADYLGLPNTITMEDYLAVRLVLEHWYCRRITTQQWQVDASVPAIRGYFNHQLDEFFVRYHTYNTVLPEYLQQVAERFLESQEDIQPSEWHQLAHQILTWNLAPDAIIPVGEDVYRKAWRLFHLAQHLAMDAQQFAQLEYADIEKLLAILHALDDPNTRGYLWLRAYEHHYSEEIFSALLNKHAQVTPKLAVPPAAQLIFCMDDREESVRRHLEEIAPQLETLGAAGVFGLPHNWRGLDAPEPVKLAQPVVTPVHEFREVVDDSVAASAVRSHQRRQRWLNALRHLKNHQMRHSVWRTALALPVLAGFALLELLGRGFMPATYQRWRTQLQRWVSLPLPTRVAYTASEVLACPSKEHNQHGLSMAEKVTSVANFLQLVGLTRGFAPLVVLMAHRSRHLNNPHILGYGCGACSGRFGGPNARAFAGIANEPAVRAQLAAEHGIVIPDTCRFVAGEHDTCSDAVDWFDTDWLPDTHQEVLQQVRTAVQRAVERSSHERCRKFASAPAYLLPKQAHYHVQGRAAAPDQVRAELGHQGCAVAFIGSRELSKGIFWDRRAFLISYDPHHDPDGRLLEAQLQGNGVVGLGIQMDYYFSRMQSGYLGSGSKATHNITGLFGVMEGGSSDLRTGLAQQMVELHEPMRLLVVVEAAVETVEVIYQRHAYLRQLLDNEWLLLAVKPPSRNEIYQFKPGVGFVLWHGTLHQLPRAVSSMAWYSGHRDHLSPAMITGERAYV